MARKKLKSKTSYNIPLVLGLLLISIFSIWRYHQARILSFNAKEIAKVDSSGIKPVYIKSYPIGIDIDIKESTIKDGVWAIHPNSANYLVTSAGIGDSGNIIVYGHNTNEIFGPIRWMKVEDLIQVMGSDDKERVYVVVKTGIVDPNNLSYIKPTDKETLTLYTCTGFFDSKRFIVVAELKK